MIRGALCLLALLASSVPAQDDPWVVYPGGTGGGAGKHIVLIAGDEEYRSEEAMPMLGRVLSVHHGFKCTVLFSTNPETGEIDPNNQTHIPGMRHVADADLVIAFLRFRELPDEDMKHFDAFVQSGKPVIGVRTSTHAFRYSRNKESPYEKYSTGSRAWKRGFGGHILGETWVNHHGHHGRQSTRGVIEPGQEKHPVLQHVKDVWGPTDVYGVRNLPDDAVVLLRGAVIENMKPDGKPVDGKKNQPMMPLVWTRSYKTDGGVPARSMCSTIGAASDMASDHLRRVFVNACYWMLDMEVPANAKVDLVGSFNPTPFGFGKFRQGIHPRDLRLPTIPPK